MAPIKSTAFGYMSMFTDKVEEDNFLVGIGVTYSTTQVFQPGNGYEYVFFTAPGYLSIGVGGQVDLLLVGGGGGGGNGGRRPSPAAYYGGGGGGAGGYLEKLDFTLPIGFYEIRVGSGGISVVNSSGSPAYKRLGTSGDPSTITGPTITDLIAYGGGGGAGAFDTPPNTPASNASDGGSGGGGAHSQTIGEGNRTTATAPATGSPIPSYLQNQGAVSVQGHPGGFSNNLVNAGGGGGAGGAGNGYPQVSENSHGGIGRAAWSDDPGIPPAYGTPGPTPGRYFAGGGGGANSTPGVLGGAGGGGRGADRYPSAVQTSTAGTVNTGGGGGGGAGEDSSNNYKGQPGGPGIIIIRYKI